MTDKRFIIDDAGSLIDMHTRDTFDYVSDVCDLLNEQYETIQQLQHDASILIQANQDYRKENEQLKQFKEDVFNKVDMHLRMLPTARDNEFDEDDGDPSLYVGAIYMLETLKKELEE